MWHAKVLTLFPEMFPGTLGHSIARKAQENNIWSLESINIRDYAKDNHGSVDDTPYGGGVGMVMRPDVLSDAVEGAIKTFDGVREEIPLFIMSPRGSTLTQQNLQTWVTKYKKGALFVCPRYEGIDQRFVEYYKNNTNFYEVSVGDYILSGGDLAAQILIDSWVRLLPGVLLKDDAKTIQSFSLDLLEFSQYTKPRIWNKMTAPEILLSGHHENIAKWRAEEAKKITKERRPDLWLRYLEKSGEQ